MSPDREKYGAYYDHACEIPVVESYSRPIGEVLRAAAWWVAVKVWLICTPASLLAMIVLFILGNPLAWWALGVFAALMVAFVVDDVVIGKRLRQPY